MSLSVGGANTLDPPAGAAGKLAQETLYMAVEDR
jgi:hypothetical protein